MILIGRLISPYVRRTAILLDLLGLEFELKEISAVNEQEKVRRYSPVGRVPALVTDDGTLIDSTAIGLTLLDRHDEAGRLWPKTGELLTRALQMLAIANGALEKAVAAHYERTRRPQEFVYQPWTDLCESQSLGGIDALEDMIGSDFAIAGRMTYADVALATGLTFLANLPAVSFKPDRHARLEALRARCEDLAVFRARMPY